VTTALRNTGIEPVGEMPWGTHFCHFYETRDDLLETLLPFFRAGLEAGEFCAWVVSEPLTEEEVWKALDRAVPGLDRYVSDQSIEVFPSSRPSGMAWGWGCRSAVPSLRLTEDGCGRAATRITG
jgi:hypothetical protein